MAKRYDKLSVTDRFQPELRNVLNHVLPSTMKSYKYNQSEKGFLTRAARFGKPLLDLRPGIRNPCSDPRTKSKKTR